jgi:hypothetical protein
VGMSDSMEGAMMDDEARDALQLSREDLDRMAREGDPAELAARGPEQTSSRGAISLSSTSRWRVRSIKFEQERAIEIASTGSVVISRSTREP